jgi:hypothetical protein
MPLRAQARLQGCLRLADQSGQPVPGVTVRLTCRNYSAELDSHEIDANTGCVRTRSIQRPDTQRFVGPPCRCDCVVCHGGDSCQFRFSTGAYSRSETGLRASPSTNKTLLWTGPGNPITWNPGLLLRRESWRKPSPRFEQQRRQEERSTWALIVNGGNPGPRGEEESKRVSGATSVL